MHKTGATYPLRYTNTHRHIEIVYIYFVGDLTEKTTANNWLNF